MIQRAFAPSAIFTPISRVRSLTTAYMMFATPMPPTRSVIAPMRPRKISMPIDIFRPFVVFLTMFQVDRARSSVGS